MSKDKTKTVTLKFTKEPSQKKPRTGTDIGKKLITPKSEKTKPKDK